METAPGARAAVRAQRFAQHHVAFPHSAGAVTRARGLVDAAEARQDTAIQPTETPAAECLEPEEQDGKHGDGDEAVGPARERLGAVDGELRAAVPDEQRQRHEQHQTDRNARGDEPVEEMEHTHGQSAAGT